MKAIKLVVASALLALSASSHAWWGGPWNGFNDGNMFGDGDFAFNMSARGRGHGYGYGDYWDHPWYGYGPYGGGYPGWGGYPYGGGYAPVAYAPYGYGAPVAGVAENHERAMAEHQKRIAEQQKEMAEAQQRAWEQRLATLNRGNAGAPQNGAPATTNNNR